MPSAFLPTEYGGTENELPPLTQSRGGTGVCPEVNKLGTLGGGKRLNSWPVETGEMGAGGEWMDREGGEGPFPFGGGCCSGVLPKEEEPR